MELLFRVTAARSPAGRSGRDPTPERVREAVREIVRILSENSAKAWEKGAARKNREGLCSVELSRRIQLWRGRRDSNPQDHSRTAAKRHPRGHLSESLSEFAVRGWTTFERERAA